MGGEREGEVVEVDAVWIGGRRPRRRCEPGILRASPAPKARDLIKSVKKKT